MTVENSTVVDSIARMPDGRYLLVMTEHRYYIGGDLATMTDQLQQKLGSYLYLIRSGGAVTMIGPDAQRGVDIELSCRDEPPAAIRDLLRSAGESVRSDGVAVRYRVLPPPAPEAVYDAIGPLLAQSAPEGWQRIDLVATLVGTGMTGSLQALMPDEGRTPLPPPQWLPQALTELKRALWEPQHGTWLTFTAGLTGTMLRPAFEFDAPSGGVGAFTRDDWAEELRRYPRTVVPAWWPAAPTA